MDGTRLLVCFDRGEDYKTLEVKVRPSRLCGMLVFLSWDKEVGMFGGYNLAAGGNRFVGKDVIARLVESPRKSQEID